MACGIGACDSAVALATSVVSRPWAVSVGVGVLWLMVWMTAFARAAELRDALTRRPWLLPLAGVVGMVPVMFDGGYPGNVATQPIWLVIVAAAVGGWKLTLATGVALFAAKAGAFAITDTGPPPLGESTHAEARTAVFLPLALVPLSLALGSALRRVIAAAEVAPEPAPAEALSPAERAVVGLLADGLTPKEIAVARGTSIETVRTQIKKAKRTAGARTLDQLVAADRRAL